MSEVGRSRPRVAIILAAGMGSRLRDVWSDLPKGFIEIGGETLIGRSTRLLRERGIERIVICAGYRAEAYHALAAQHADIQVLENADFENTGSMASLAIALEVVDEDFLLLESDLFYDEIALDRLLGMEERDVLLASGPTGATDEVWVEAKDGRLSGLSKERSEIGELFGELVGIVRVSREMGRKLSRAFVDWQRERGHGRMGYETDAIVRVAQTHPVQLCLIPELLWGEVDYESHYRRVRDEVHPAWLSRQGGA